MVGSSRTKHRDFPTHSLEKSLVIIRAIVEKGAGETMDKLLVADAIGRTPNSSEFKRLLSSSRKYGLTIGTEKAELIEPTELGLKIAKPENHEDSVNGLVQACNTPSLLERIYAKYDRNQLPEHQFLKNTLEKTFDVAPEHSTELAELVIENAKYTGILQSISGKEYIRISDPKTLTANSESSEVIPEGLSLEKDISIAPTNELAEKESASNETLGMSKSRQIFVAHGKNRKPLEALKKILDNFKIRYKVAIDEPNKGRPISAKVAELMKECSAGVFIFTCDEQFHIRHDGEELSEIWRPSENVVYELGAASILWDRKIIILKEEGVSFPSDFSDLGYITFKEGELEHRALELLQELVGLELVKVEAA